MGLQKILEEAYAIGKQYVSRFTIQSISKVITLAVALQHCGFDKVFDKMSMEPSRRPAIWRLM